MADRSASLYPSSANQSMIPWGVPLGRQDERVLGKRDDPAAAGGIRNEKGRRWLGLLAMDLASTNGDGLRLATCRRQGCYGPVGRKVLSGRASTPRARLSRLSGKPEFSVAGNGKNLRCNAHTRPQGLFRAGALRFQTGYSLGDGFGLTQFSSSLPRCQSPATQTDWDCSAVWPCPVTRRVTI